MNPDKAPLESKKFIAYVVADVSWSLLSVVAMGVFFYVPSIFMATVVTVMILVKGFIQAGYIGSQAWLDRYIKLAAIAEGKSSETPPTGNQP